jgi:hypothetical protein
MADRGWSGFGDEINLLEPGLFLLIEIQVTWSPVI